MKKLIVTMFVLAAAVILANVRLGPGAGADAGDGGAVRSAVGDPKILREKYERWKARVLARSSAHLSLTLVPQDVHVKRPPSGRIEIDLDSKTLRAHVQNIDTAEELGLWLTQGATLFSADSEGSEPFFVGAFSALEDALELETNIGGVLAAGRKIDQLVVAPLDTEPLRTGLLAASPTLFQRLLAAEQAAGNVELGESSKSVFDAILPTAQASHIEYTGFPYVFNDLVTQGEDLFLNETFAGNGRTCGTCHPATNNFTIDKPFIDSLPPDDPLFVAEFNPFLIFGHPYNKDVQGNPRRFENPALMRELGLIVENLDGMGDLENRFTMRGVPHNLGMTVSIATPDGELTPPDERTGWSGEGAPSGIVGGIAVSGRLRDFAVGAIVQHFPRTMNRSFDGPYPDFRAPTTTELDAIEAFMLSLGRQAELQLDEGFADTLILADESAERGKRLFRDGPGEAGGFTCNSCHNNAGANTGGTNRNFDTNTEEFLRNRIDDPDFHVVGQPRPVDGGFGTNPDGDFTSLEEQPGFVNENFGDGTFNNVSLVEAADTPPFFHNNVAQTLEDSILFYQSDEFVATGRPAIDFNQDEVADVANFMRVINAIDNVENSALRQADRALIAAANPPPYGPNLVMQHILDIVKADTKDAIQVLKQGNLHGGPYDAVAKLDAAVQKVNYAYGSGYYWASFFINQAKTKLQEALALMRTNG